MNRFTESLIERYPSLGPCAGSVEAAIEALTGCFSKGGKLLLCGNGGSSADCGHISGELLKGFLKKRPLSEEEKSAMTAKCPELDGETLSKLQKGLPAIPLTDFSALSTAFCNDVDPGLVYAQLTLALGRPEDILLCISTSGNASNVAEAAKTAKALGLSVIGLTGGSGGKLRGLSDILICVPGTETYKIQELHLPVYHCLCTAAEEHFFDS